VSNLLAFQYRELLITVATVSVTATAIGLFPGADGLTTGIRSGVTETDLLLFVVIAVVAGIVKGTVGFGFALVSTPIFATVIDPTLAVVVLSIPPWMINLFQIGETQTGLTYVRQQWSLLTLALIGSVIGVFFLSTISIGPLILFLMGLVILAYVGFQLAMNFTVIEGADHPVGLGAAGFSTGFLMGVTNFGPILSAYLHTFERNTERYVGGLSMVFLLVYTERIIQMSVVGLLTPYRLWLGSAIAVVALVGLGVGTYLRHLEIDERKFNWLVVGILLVIGLNILRETVPALLG
jgi:uncharacterized membrane protein YfcA